MLRNLVRAAALSAALCALGAIGSSTALAAGEFTVGQAPAAITGSEVVANAFEVTNSTTLQWVKIKCSAATFEGTTSTASGTELTLTGRYTACTLGGLAAEVRMNGCKYTLTGSAALTASVDIVGCTSGKKIEIIKGNCTITVPEQTGLAHVTFTSEGTASTMDTLATATFSTINNTQTGSECPDPGLTSSDGTYKGTVTFKAFGDGGTRSATHNGHTYQEVICSSQVSLTVD
jgi:hypothetical protein